MSTVKTKINQDVVYSFLKENFDDSLENLTFIQGGEMSQAFSFTTRNGNFVVRINKNAKSFYKDEYAFLNFTSVNVPIPKMIQIGSLNESYCFAISVKAEGKHITDLTQEEFNKTLPSLLGGLDCIHKINIETSTGYGKWNIDSNAPFKTWRDFIKAVKNFPDKENLFETSFLEKDVYQEIYTEIERLANFCPEERYLVHGDYGNNNTVSDGDKVTGVFDWAESLYGDFVYDIAWLLFWSTNKDKNKLIKDYYQTQNVENLEERLLCYKLRIGLGSLSFYAYSNQREKYDSIKQRTLDLLL